VSTYVLEFAGQGGGVDGLLGACGGEGHGPAAAEVDAVLLEDCGRAVVAGDDVADLGGRGCGCGVMHERLLGVLYRRA